VEDEIKSRKSRDNTHSITILGRLQDGGKPEGLKGPDGAFTNSVTSSKAKGHV